MIKKRLSKHTNNKSIQCTLSGEVAATLDYLSEQLGVTRSYLINEVLRSHILSCIKDIQGGLNE